MNNIKLQLNSNLVACSYMDLIYFLDFLTSEFQEGLVWFERSGFQERFSQLFGVRFKIETLPLLTAVILILKFLKTYFIF